VGLFIDADAGRMSCMESPHTATLSGGKWRVTWLPGRRLGWSEALTAMTIACEVAAGAAPHGRHWPVIVALAGELGLSGQEAVAMCVKGKGRQS
jgi:hypothetical protein